jgi:hypothetical protein
VLDVVPRRPATVGYLSDWRSFDDRRVPWWCLGTTPQSSAVQNLRCLLSDMIVEKGWPQSEQRILWRQSACILL